MAPKNDEGANETLPAGAQPGPAAAPSAPAKPAPAAGSVAQAPRAAPASAGQADEGEDETPKGMVRIKCELPNASDLINGVKFQRAGGGKKKGREYMLSEPVPEDVAEQFAGIPGYSII